jgi:hypothetical protein
MFEQALQASEAHRQVRSGVLNPALYGCRDCGEQRMITSPEPIRCADCGAPYTMLSSMFTVVADLREQSGRMTG